VHAGDLPAGSFPGQPCLADGRLLDTALGAGFAVLAADDSVSAALPAADRLKFDQLGTRWLVDPALTAWLGALGTPLVVMRPDRYVFGVATGPDQLANLAGRLPTCQERPQTSMEQTP
ncbi:MAG: hypothetical protein LH632_21970, partial [Rhodoferax sp.]|nr:hypothetical protein [Rhodoferax sp.]